MFWNRCSSFNFSRRLERCSLYLLELCFFNSTLEVRRTSLHATLTDVKVVLCAGLTDDAMLVERSVGVEVVDSVGDVLFLFPLAGT